MGTSSSKHAEHTVNDVHKVNVEVTRKEKTHDTFNVDRKFTEHQKGSEVYGRALSLKDSINDKGAEMCIGKDCK